MDTITTQAMDTKFIYMHVYSHANHKFKLKMEATQAINIPTTQAMDDELVDMHISTNSKLETT